MKTKNIRVVVLAAFFIVVLGGNNAFADPPPNQLELPSHGLPSGATLAEPPRLVKPIPVKPIPGLNCGLIHVNYKQIVPEYSVPRKNIYPNQIVPDGVIVSETVEIAIWEASCPERCSLPSNVVNGQCLPPNFTGIPPEASKYMFPIIFNSVDCRGMKEGPHPRLMCKSKK